MTRFKLTSWNVNGLRAVTKKNALQDFLSAEQPDILCLQEIKAKPEQFDLEIPNYQILWNSAERPGYSGTATLIRTNSPATPVATFNNFPEDLQQSYPWHEDQYGNPLSEGRLQTLKFANFYLVNVYTPNAKPNLSRLALRSDLWDPAFCQYLSQLATKKPVISCGDFNAAHTSLDLARPEANDGHAGFTPEERQGVTNLIGSGLIDTFRYQHPSEQRYTWWSHWGQARAHNVGWRIDYFFISPQLTSVLDTAEIHEQYLGSDHCPISLILDFSTHANSAEQAVAGEQPSTTFIAPVIEAPEVTNQEEPTATGSSSSSPETVLPIKPNQTPQP